MLRNLIVILGNERLIKSGSINLMPSERHEWPLLILG